MQSKNVIKKSFLMILISSLLGLSLAYAADGGKIGELFKKSGTVFVLTGSSVLESCGNNGVLVQTGGSVTCKAVPVQEPVLNCIFNGNTVINGSSVTAWSLSNPIYPTTCASQTRTCTNGILSGTYTNASCIQGYTYSWSPNDTTSGWSSCNVTCGGGTQIRTVACLRNDGQVVNDSYCTGTKPAESQSCNTQACSTGDIFFSGQITRATSYGNFTYIGNGNNSILGKRSDDINYTTEIAYDPILKKFNGGLYAQYAFFESSCYNLASYEILSSSIVKELIPSYSNDLTWYGDHWSCYSISSPGGSITFDPINKTISGQIRFTGGSTNVTLTAVGNSIIGSEGASGTITVEFK